MISYNPNRFRISTKFTLLKVVLAVGFISIAFNLISELRNDTISSKSIAPLTLGIIALTSILYFITTRNRIDYDDIKQTLYIVDTKKHTEVEIPVESIDKILYSSMGGERTGSYLIVYRDFHNHRQKVRLFPCDNSIETVKMDAQLKNPNFVTRNWSIGWNELFD